MDKHEVFISYHAGSSTETARKICAALEGAGISCWFAPKDADGNYAQAIVKAIRSCKVFLLLLNEQSNMSGHVLNEINCAFDRFKNHEEIALLPFRMDDCELSDDVYYYLGRIRIMDGTLPPEMLRIQELVDRVCLLLGRKPERTVVVRDENGALQAPRKNREYRITGSMVYPDTKFVGRRQELEQIGTALSGVVNKLFLVGMGGIGKSELAKKYLVEHAGDYDVILWVPFGGTLLQTVSSDVLLPIQGISRSDWPEDSDREYFSRKLSVLRQIADRRVLIVVDNFDVSGDEDLEEFCSGAYGVLFTTRYHQEDAHVPEVEIHGMDSEADLMELFRSEYSRRLDAAGTEQVREILRQLDGHPLSIRLVASAMQSRRLSPGDMAKLLRSGAAGMAKQNARAADLIFGRLRQVFRISTLTEEEQYLLKNLSLLGLQGVEVQQLFDWCGLDDYDVIDGLIAKSWVIHNPVTDEVHLHPLVADLMAETLEEDPDCCRTLLHSLEEACRTDTSYTWEEKQRLNGYAGAVYDRLPKSHPLSSMALEIKARLTMSMALYFECSELYRELLESLPADASLERRLELYNKIAHPLVLGSDGERGREVALEGCALVQDIPLEQMTRMEGHWYNELLRRLVEAYVHLGDYPTAVSYGRQALAFVDDYADGDYRMQHGWVDYHLGRALYYNDELDEAEETMRNSIRAFEERGDLWSANFSYDMLSQVLMKRGQFEEALALNQKSAEILRPYFGTEHADYARNLERRGNIYKAMGRRQAAEGCFRQAAEVYQRINCHQSARKALERIE